jgi:hypothetical protein
VTFCSSLGKLSSQRKARLLHEGFVFDAKEAQASQIIRCDYTKYNLVICHAPSFPVVDGRRWVIAFQWQIIRENAERKNNEDGTGSSDDDEVDGGSLLRKASNEDDSVDEGEPWQDCRFVGQEQGEKEEEETMACNGEYRIV